MLSRFESLFFFNLILAFVLSYVMSQFIKCRNQEITEQVVRTATEGMKAADTSFQTILGNLFAPLSKKRALELGILTDEGRYVSRLSRDVEGSGAMDKIAQGSWLSFTHNIKSH